MISALLLMWTLGIDAGTPGVRVTDSGAQAPVLKSADADLIDNLELLENMDSSSDFDLLRELSVER